MMHRLGIYDSISFSFSFFLLSPTIQWKLTIQIFFFIYIFKTRDLTKIQTPKKKKERKTNIKFSRKVYHSKYCSQHGGSTVRNSKSKVEGMREFALWCDQLISLRWWYSHKKHNYFWQRIGCRRVGKQNERCSWNNQRWFFGGDLLVFSIKHFFILAFILFAALCFFFKWGNFIDLLLLFELDLTKSVVNSQQQLENVPPSDRHTNHMNELESEYCFLSEEVQKLQNREK